MSYSETTLISEIYDLKENKKQLEQLLGETKAAIANVDAQIANKEEILLDCMKASGNDTNTAVEGVVAAIFRRENIGYKNEDDVLNYLKSINRSDLIRVKLTESLDKASVKKAIKTDTTLAEALNEMTTQSISEYVVVTSTDNYSKMLEHITDGK